MADFPKLTKLSDEHIPIPFPPTLGTELSAPFFLNFLFTNNSFIVNQISLLYHLFFLNLFYSCPYSYNLMLTTTYMCQPYAYSYYLQSI